MAAPGLGIREAAEAVLRSNDRGGFTRGASVLYPHQWSWDSAIVAVGWAHLDLGRAITEFEGVLDAQWANGKLPHIIFRPGTEEYRPGPELWDSAAAPEAPTGIATSGLAAPPVHATAALAIWQIGTGRGSRSRAGADAFAARIFPALLAWHRYLARERDPDGSGLLSIHHPWESFDNAPEWDGPLRSVAIEDVRRVARHDIEHVPSAERPSEAEYARFLGLVASLREANYDERLIRRNHPFLCKDPAMTSLFVASSDALLELATVVGAPRRELSEINAWGDLGRAGLERVWDEADRLCHGVDERRGTALRARSIGGLLPLLAVLGPHHRAELLAELDSGRFAGNSSLRWALPPTVSPVDPAFASRNYWRGPSWPVINWLLWIGLHRSGFGGRATRLRSEALSQLEAGGLAEYFEPFTGAPLGARNQSWTAAVAIDWLERATPG